MCGICGAFHEDPAINAVSSVLLGRMMRRMERRGPDGHGCWISDDRRIGLGHRRLAVIDLSDAGRQPFWSHDRRFVITFNGEIYNYKGLRAELRKRGATFATNTDTETILEILRVEGPEGFMRLRGMYAFAIWDTVERQLVLARDPFGIKPLYVYEKDGVLRFASQVKALLAAGDIDTTADAAGHAGFVIWGHVPEPFTLYRHIAAFPAGTYRIVRQDRGGRAHSFADVLAALRTAEDVSRRGTAAAPEPGVLSTLMGDSIAHHHVADVPVGVFLSGGTDSSVIAALSAQASSESLRTFTLGFREFQGTPHDETPQAEETARYLGARHVTKWVTAHDFEEALADVLDAMDQPSVDGVNTYFVARYAAEAGLKVALSGLGGDELFGGYPSFSDVPRAAGVLAPVPKALGTMLRRWTQSWIGRVTSPKYAGLLEYGGTLAGAYLLRRALFMPWEIDGFLHRDLALEGLARLAPMADLDQKIDGLKDPYVAVMALEFTVYLRDRLLRDADWASMSHSLELRTPFVDWELFTALLPYLVRRHRLRKDELIAVGRDWLPLSVGRRRKTGFSVPVREWMIKGGSEKAPRGLRGFARVVYSSFVA